MSILSDKILALTRQLYPQGRAFKMPYGGFLESLHRALGNSEAQAWTDAASILYDILPDNANFTEDDATDWERRLGLIYSPLVSLPERMMAIQNKLNQPGNNPAKGSFLYLQEQLNNAGFSVNVYENRFLESGTYVTKTPQQLSGGAFITYNQHGQFRHGQRQHGGGFNNMVVNNISEAADTGFDFGGAFRNTFFIGGRAVGGFATVPVERKDEFRQLILRTKPVQTICFLFINYI